MSDRYVFWIDVTSYDPTDPTGIDWDEYVPTSVLAANEDEACEKVNGLLPPPPDGHRWAARLISVTPVSANEKAES